MSQHDQTIANDSRTNVRTDIQSALQALASTSKGNSAPATPYTGQMWLDDNTPSSTVWTVNLYDGSDSIPWGYFDTTNNGFGLQLGYTSRFFQTSTDTPGYTNTITGGALEKNAQGAALFLSRSQFASLWLNVNADDNVAAFQRSGVNVGNISVTNSLVTYGTTSDRRAKNILGPVADAIRRLRRIKVFRATFKADKRKRRHDVFIADQLQELAPYAVTGRKGAVDKAGRPVFQGVDPGKVVPLVVAALQGAFDKIDALERRLAALERR